MTVNEFIDKSFEPYQFHIQELEKENAELRNNGFTVSAMTEQRLKEALEKGERLEKENAELKTKVTALEKENAELKKTVEHYRKEREFFIGEVEK